MKNLDRIELFVLKCAVLHNRISNINNLIDETTKISEFKGDFIEKDIEKYIKQFTLSNRTKAHRMANYYRIFYMLENDIRSLIVETLQTAHGEYWWEQKVPANVKEEVKKNRDKEEKAAITARSDEEIDYTTFGQLGDIIRDNWIDFAGIMTNQSAVSRVLSALNMLRGTIAHCGDLADDEVDRLKLSIKDWFRVLQGPKA
jgi:Swt1-like HEPN